MTHRHLAIGVDLRDDAAQPLCQLRELDRFPVLLHAGLQHIGGEDVNCVSVEGCGGGGGANDVARCSSGLECF